MTLRNFVKTTHNTLPKNRARFFNVVKLPSFIRQHHDSRSYRVWCRVVWYTVTKLSEEPAVIIFRSEHLWMVTKILNYRFKAQWSLYVPPSSTFSNSTLCPHSVFMCFFRNWEQAAIISLYSINWLVFITATVSVYCAVRTVSLTITQV